jgi:hypothetical protein
VSVSIHPDAKVGRMTRLRLLLATLTVLTALVARVPAAAQPSSNPPAGGNPIPGNGGVFELAWTGDISPPVGEPRGDDYGTSELALAGQPDAVALPGDLVYECGSPAAFTSPVGYQGSWGRLKGISYFPTLGNHDVCEAGAGAPSWREYFADQLANLPCTQLTPPCRPDLGYYDRDLDVDTDGRPDWYILVLASDCQRFNGSTGDTETASCADGSPQHEWLKAAMSRRHGGQTSGQKCSIAIWHHERWGTTTFGDDPSTKQFILTLNHFHNDIILSGHAHALARLGAMTWDGHLAAEGQGQRQITAGVGGRSRLPYRVDPTGPGREGTRYRSNSNYGIGWLRLTASQSSAGWTGGSWTHEFRLVGNDGQGSTVDQATAGCWP